MQQLDPILPDDDEPSALVGLRFRDEPVDDVDGLADSAEAQFQISADTVHLPLPDPGRGTGLTDVVEHSRGGFIMLGEHQSLGDGESEARPDRVSEMCISTKPSPP